MHPDVASDHAGHAGFEAHCDHEHGSALSHLFCLHSAREQPGELRSSCPHEGAAHAVMD